MIQTPQDANLIAQLVEVLPLHQAKLDSLQRILFAVRAGRRSAPGGAAPGCFFDAPTRPLRKEAPEEARAADANAVALRPPAGVGGSAFSALLPLHQANGADAPLPDPAHLLVVFPNVGILLPYHVVRQRPRRGVVFAAALVFPHTPHCCVGL